MMPEDGGIAKARACRMAAKAPLWTLLSEAVIPHKILAYFLSPVIPGDTQTPTFHMSKCPAFLGGNFTVNDVASPNTIFFSGKLLRMYVVVA